MHPQIPRTQPAIKEHKTWGSLKSKSTIEALLSLLKAPLIRSIGERLEDPIHKSIANRIIAREKITARAHHFLRVSLL